MTEQETLEIHGRKGRKAKFNQNEGEGVDVGGMGTSGDCPSLRLILTEYTVYVINNSSENIVGQADIEFEYQWYDEDRNEVSKDDPTRMSGEPTEPKEGAVKAAIKEASNKGHGFIQGWRTRHRKGPQYQNIEKFTESFKELSSVEEIVKITKKHNEFEAKIDIENEAWGLPGEIYNWLDDHPTLEMVDISDISDESIHIFINRDKSRSS